MKQAKVGDRVAYSVDFLRSIGEAHGSMARARGTVEAVTQPARDWQLATIAWDTADMPERVNVRNLAKVGPNRDFCAI